MFQTEFLSFICFQSFVTKSEISLIFLVLLITFLGSTGCVKNIDILGAAHQLTTGKVMEISGDYNNTRSILFVYWQAYFHKQIVYLNLISGAL